MDQPPRTCANQSTVPIAAPQGPTIPGYEILEELGRGGMGVVYRARQTEPPRLVALKLIRDGALASREDRARFRIESEAAGRMQHPNVVEIYEVGEHQGQPYLAMELVEGGSLDQYLAGTPQPPRRVVELVRTLALAIHHAHSQKVIHRDLKPANILLTGQRWTKSADGRTASVAPLSMRQPKITDFGLAKRLDSQSTAWTQDGAVLGTASYMAPEQAAGRVQEIGPAADVYALGAILYEMLTGRPPFQAATWNETVQQVLHDEPLAPSRLQEDLPRDLETVCLKCLEKEPARRYPSALELAQDLDRFLRAEPVSAVALTEAERLGRLARRDGYEIIASIGRGPRSAVYHALSGPLQQPVALKVFVPGAWSRHDWEARLRRSSELWAALSHPQIVSIQRAGWWDGRAYVASEYVAHGCLAARLTGRPYPVSDVLALVAQLAEIVCYLHRQGINYGNLKPSNVLFAANGIPRLVDFSLLSAPGLGPVPSHDAPVSGVEYLAPELLGEPRPDPRPHTDTYGLGAILYALLTGQAPFMGATSAEAVERVRQQDPVRPSQINPEVTAPLEGFCLRCLHKNPWRRYQRAYDVLKRLRYFQDRLGGKGIPAPPRSRRSPSR